MFPRRLGGVQAVSLVGRAGRLGGVQGVQPVGRGVTQFANFKSVEGD